MKHDFTSVSKNISLSIILALRYGYGYDYDLNKSWGLSITFIEEKIIYEHSSRLTEHSILSSISITRLLL